MDVHAKLPDKISDEIIRVESITAVVVALLVVEKGGR